MKKENQKLGHWIYNGSDICINNMIGFVYCITCNITNKKYIGKKLLIFKKKKKPLKGRVNCRRSIIESDWKIYCGSSNKLNADIEKLGKENFTFEMLAFYPSKLLLAYHETKEIIIRNAIFSEEYYNEVCNCRLRNKKKS